jgi:CheY-like chemotaxis protein
MTHPALERSILVVDDNSEAADLMVELLTLCGHTAVAAYSGVDGLSLAERFKPEIILLDLTMPGMDGFAVAKIFRESESYRGVVLVAFTALSDPITTARVAHEGFDYHLPKPVSIGRVMDVISKARSQIALANNAAHAP